jgi:hypothetical protein
VIILKSLARAVQVLLSLVRVLEESQQQRVLPLRGVRSQLLRRMISPAEDAV